MNNITNWWIRKSEKEADMIAAQHGNAKGGIDFLESVRLAGLADKKRFAQGSWKERLTALQIDSQGNERLDFDHPTLTTRIAYLKPIAVQQAAVKAAHN